jgi:hypothetical protein
MVQTSKLKAVKVGINRFGKRCATVSACLVASFVCGVVQPVQSDLFGELDDKSERGPRTR